MSYANIYRKNTTKIISYYCVLVENVIIDRKCQQSYLIQLHYKSGFSSSDTYQEYQRQTVETLINPTPIKHLCH